MLLPERQQRVTGHRRNLVMRAENRARKRMLAEIRFRQQVVDQILRRILAHGNLLKNDAALFFKFRFIHSRVEQQVAKQIHRTRQMLGYYLGIIAGAFLCGKRIDLPAERIHLDRNFLCGAVLRAFKEHMLHKVRKAALLRRFIH